MESQRQEKFDQIENTNLLRSTHQSGSGYIYRTRNNSQLSSECLIKMFCAHQLCDIVLVSQEREIYAHKVILAASSTFFYHKFTKDANLGLPKRISMEFIDFKTLSAVVKFLYTSEVRIGNDNVEQLLAAAHNLAVKDLQEACWHFLRKNLDAGNCLDTVKMARRYQSESLCSTVSDYLKEHFSEVAAADKHLQMDYSEFSDVIGRDVVCSAEELLDHVVSWVRSDFDNRRGYFCPLIANIEFSSVSHEYFLKKIDEESWLLNEPPFVLKYVKSLKVEKPAVPLTKRAESSKLLVVVGITDKWELSI